MSKKPKQTRNRFKDTLWDYYATNREITKEYEEACRNKPREKKWSRNEKLYLSIIALGVIGIVIRYVIL